MSIQKPWYKVIVALFKKKSKSILRVCRTMCTSTSEWINKMWYYMQWNIIWQDRHPDVFYNMDEHWKHYAELVKANTDSSEDDETTSKEQYNGNNEFFSFSSLPIIDSLNSERLLEIEKDVRIWFQVIIQCTLIRY